MESFIMILLTVLTVLTCCFLVMAIHITIVEACKERKSCHKLYPVFGFGPVREQGKEPVVRTPQFFSSRKGRILFMAKISASQEAVISVNFTDKKGNVAQPDGVPEWFTDNTDVLALTPAADGLSCTARAVGPLGTATVTMKADGKVGPEVKEIVGTLEIEVGAGDASVVNLQMAAPTEQPEPTQPTV